MREITMEDENLKQAKELATDVSKKTWAITKHLSKWSWKKSKEGYAASKKWAEEATEKRRVEAEKQAERDKAEKIRQREIRQEYREDRHDSLLETLSDDFNVLEHNLKNYLQSLNSTQIKEMLEQVNITKKTYGGSSNANAATFGHNMVSNVFISKYKNMCKKGGNHFISRTVADLSDKEIGVLKFMSLLNIWNFITDKHFEDFFRCIVYNSGSSTLKVYRSASSDDNVLGAALSWRLKQYIDASNLAVNEAIATIGEAKSEVDDPEIKDIFERELKGASGWMNAGRL